MRNFSTLLLLLLLGCVQAHHVSSDSSEQTTSEDTSKPILPGAYDTERYLPLLKGKKVGVVANYTATIGSTHLVDSLLSMGIEVVKIFGPEHGFRGNSEAGEQVKHEVDPQTNLPIISLYGKHKKPSPENLKRLDVVVFDIQDVGVRFFTYISTLHYILEACAENNLPCIVLDRPNPNGNYIDGPVLEKSHKSFVGMHEIPVVYGMTIGELGLMMNGEGWLKNGVSCELEVIKCQNWTHDKIYELPLKASPNLPNMTAVYLYPSLCFFEGTVVSAGRGTDFPFQTYGHPNLPQRGFSFTPRSIKGFSLHPKFKGVLCQGVDLQDSTEYRKLSLSFLLDAYQQIGNKTFFNSFFEKLAGTSQLREQIVNGMTEAEIRQSWQEDLNIFKQKRAKYLLYE